MQYQLLHQGSNSVLLAQLKAEESIKAEAGAMVAKSDNMEITGHLWGGILRAFKRMLLGGESFLFQEIRARRSDGYVIIAPAILGDIAMLPLENGQDYFIKNGCLLAGFGELEVDTRLQRLSRGLFSGAGLFVLHVMGHGQAAVSSFGAIMEIAVPAGQNYVVDNGHIVAWSGDIQYEIVKAGRGWISSFLSGEGLACRFHGPGKIWLQTRNPGAFGSWVSRYARVRGGVSIF